MNFFSLLFGRGNNSKKADLTYLLSEEAKRAAAWIETTNPLRGMTASRMQALYDASRNGDTVHLQWLYNEIEKSDPTLLICASRRRGALASLDWSIKTRSEGRSRHYDKVLAEEQAKALEAAFGEAELGGFNEALEHLASAFFRGFAHVLPKWSADRLVLEGFETLDNWNFVRDITTGTWYWNPEANAYTDYGSCRPIPKGELLTMVAPYHIDYPMLTIYLRQAVGEKGWAKFTERFGIPPVILTMPDDIPGDQVDFWRAQAEKVAEGGSGAVPAGTAVNFCDGARGINPFKDFIHNQRELTVLMATGGLLTSLAQSGSGTLAGGAHSDTWAEIRRMDSAKIASALNAQIVRPLLVRAFPGRPPLAYFDFDTESTPSPGEVFEDAAKARSAGYLIDQAELEEKTGYKLVRESGNGNEGTGNGLPELKLNKDHSPLPIPHSPVLDAFTKDSSPAAEAIKELLNDPSKEKAEETLKKLPELLPEDPAMAAVIAEAMAAEFREEVLNTGTSAGAKKGWETRRKNGWTPEILAKNQDIVNSLVDGLSAKGNDGKGKAWKNEPKELGAISESLASDIAAANPRMRATAGTMQTIDQKQLNHAFIEHGEKEKLKTNIPITKDDLKKIPDVLSDYDEIVAGKGIADGKKQEAVIFRKKYPDGTINCVEIDWFRRGDKRHELKFQTMWKEDGKNE
ncbi:MAG: DUF935 family protein [Kiritimatiellae bacterium]|nr:DUF935 family protein [Kiritimatiellia bacterium]